MGFAVTRFIIVEVMGKYSNLLFTDENKRIITALKLIDFSTSRLRQVLPGMIYEMPPAQNKKDVFALTADELSMMLTSADGTMPLHKFVLNNFLGISPLVARELAYLATGNVDTPIEQVLTYKLWNVLCNFTDLFKNKQFRQLLSAYAVTASRSITE